MTDRELIDWAAKAAGIRDDGEGPRVDDEEGFYLRAWNPLVDDGDALRLAVKLKMRIGIDAIPVGYVVVISDDKFRPDIHERIENDAEAATRRAIVRAAAEIGKAMQAAT